MKALSVDHNLKLTHELSGLMDHLKANRVIDNVTWTLLQEQVLIVTGREDYKKLRYPEENQLFWEGLTLQETKILLNAGRTIVEICKTKVDAESTVQTLS